LFTLFYLLNENKYIKHLFQKLHYLLLLLLFFNSRSNSSMTGNRNAKLVVERYLLTKIMNKPTKAYINEKKNNNNNNNNKQLIVYGYLTFY